MKEVKRCAIYTRKSTEEGLDQEFNSLDAQREACEAYILSQKHEGWKALPDQYNDGGFSGGNMDRPALHQLLEDINAGKVQVVVVYKVDRLTRSLPDFAKIVEQFDAQGVSFVSVTQQFNTTSSMGRLTLNVLLSFAQFEREVAGERIRDKIAASKKKGMWMGGTLSLGYGVEDKKLYVISEEAERVRTIYKTYLKLGCVRRLQGDLSEQAILSKSNKPFSRGALYQILKNPLYLGKVKHKGKIYDGQHDAIMDEALWQKVQDKLKEQSVKNEMGKLTSSNALLMGILYGKEGQRLSPTHSNKRGRRYRYYIDGDAARSPAKHKQVQRIPAQELEEMVLQKLQIHLKQQEEVFDLALYNNLKGQDRQQQREAILKLVQKVLVLSKSVVVELKDGEKLTISYQFVPVGRSKKMTAEGSHVSQSQTLLKNLIRGYCLRERLYASTDMTMAKLVKEEGVNGSYLMELINLTYMEPREVEGVIKGSI